MCVVSGECCRCLQRAPGLFESSGALLGSAAMHQTIWHDGQHGCGHIWLRGPAAGTRVVARLVADMHGAVGLQVRQQSWSQLWVRRWLQASCLLVCSGDGSVPLWACSGTLGTGTQVACRCQLAGLCQRAQRRLQ